MAEEKQVRGRDIAAPLDTLEVSGKQYKLAFTNETFRLAEDVYEYRYGRAKNFAEIAMDLTRSKIAQSWRFCTVRLWQPRRKRR